MGYFDIYGKLAERDLNDVCQNGRYLIQADAVPRILPDIERKLRPCPTDSLLDVGCGTGGHLLPLSRCVRRAVGVDHPKVIDKLRQRSGADRIELIGGNFLDVAFDEQFDRVLCYCMVHVMPDEPTLTRFVMKLVDALSPTGRGLIGDIANADKKRRFLASERGKAFQAEWQRRSANDTERDVFDPFAEFDTVAIDDRVMLDLVAMIRRRGYHAYLVDQPQDLPFGNTREDLLIVGPEYADPPTA